MQREIDSLARRIERLMIDEKKSAEEIGEMLEKGTLRP